jgi:hypothetical protein
MTCTSPVDARLCTDCGARYAAGSFDVGAILQGGFNILSRYPQAVAAFCGVQILFGLALLPLTLAMGGGQMPGTVPVPDLGRMFPLLGGSLLASMVYTAIVYSVFIRFLGDVLEGNTRPFGEVVRAGLGHAPALFMLNLILGVILGLGSMACLVPGIFFMVTLVFSVPAVVLEPTGPFNALAISWNRTAGHRWNVFFVLLVGGAILVGVGLVGAMGPLLLGRLGTPGMVVGTVFQQGLSGLGGALLVALLVLSYLRLSGRWLPAGQG